MHLRPFVMILILTTSVSGCVTDPQPPAEPPPVSGDELCIGTREARADVARDVAKTEDDDLAVSAGTLVILIDEGCARAR